MKTMQTMIFEKKVTISTLIQMHPTISSFVLIQDRGCASYYSMASLDMMKM